MIARHIVENIKKYSPDDLLPYYDKVSQQWSLMSKAGKILTNPIKEYPGELTLINAPNVHSGDIRGVC